MGCKSDNGEVLGEEMLRLRPYKNCDARYIVSWIRDEVTFYRWSADQYRKFPICAEDMNEKYAAYAEKDDFFEMTALDDNKVVGHLIMRFLDEEKTILRFGFIIVDDTKRGKGYGKGMLSLALKYAFEILKVEKVTLGVFQNNESAYRCYTSLGFRKDSSKEPVVSRILGEIWKYDELEIAYKDWAEEN